MNSRKRRQLPGQGESFDSPTKFRIGSDCALSNDDKARIAQRAALLIAEGLADYRAAKLKAARQLGFDARANMPDNGTIDAALRTHYSLFGHDTQQQALAALRDIAVRVMSRLDEFEPWLVGPVLTGTANKNSDIDIEIIGIDPKHFEMYLLGAGIAFTLGVPPRRTRGKRSESAHVIFAAEFDHVPVLITLFESHAARLAAHPQDTLRHERVQIAGAKMRFSAISKP